MTQIGSGIYVSIVHVFTCVYYMIIGCILYLPLLVIKCDWLSIYVRICKAIG